ncbi:MAG: hypothetical protein JNK11_18440 [Alphaproteobacteria bacterium]|nr:hypothetical protein [Alphaproteobacteria bacterium]
MTANGNPAGEIARIEAMLAAQGASAGLLRRLGNLKEERGDVAGAIACYRRATESAPHDAGAWCDLAIGLEQSGDLAGAQDAFRRAIAADESFADAHANLGLLLQRSGRHPEAVAALERAASLEPSAASFHNLGNAQRLAGDGASALASYAEALKHDPSSAITATALADILAGRSQAGLADALLRRALAVAPSIGVALRRSLLLAQIEDGAASIAARRTAIAEGFAALRAAGATIRDPFAEVPGTTFYLAYHGENDRALQSQIARFYLDACPDLGWSSPHLADRANRPRGPVRLALISEKFRNHTVGKLTLDLVRALDRSQVEPLLFVVSPKDDPVQRAFRATAPTVDLAPDLATARRQVSSARPDVVLYPDIGMNLLTYFMAFARLAPVQCVSWGHPDTTGIPALDYFLTAAELEPDDFREHYSETPIALPALPTVYPRPPEPAEASRADLGLPDDATLYVCPQTLFKLHPSFDAVLASILRGDPRGLLVLLAGSEPSWVGPLLARLGRAMPDAVGRVRVLPGLSSDRFLALLRLADVVLDTPVFGGGNTSFEAFAMGAAVVTWPGAFMRSRVTAALYRRMGIPDAIVSGPEMYAATALRLGRDPTIRAALRARIAGARHRLFDDAAGARALGRFCKAVAAAHAAGKSLGGWEDVPLWEG